MDIMGFAIYFLAIISMQAWVEGTRAPERLPPSLKLWRTRCRTLQGRHARGSPGTSLVIRSHNHLASRESRVASPEQILNEDGATALRSRGLISPNTSAEPSNWVNGIDENTQIGDILCRDGGREER